MKIAAVLLTFLVLFLPDACPQDSTQLNLPEGAVDRIGKGSVEEILYSPDGTRLAVVSSIGIWLYDTETYQEVVLLAGHTDKIYSVSFSPDGKTLAGGSGRRVELWDAATGELKRTFTGHTDKIYRVSFSPDGKTLASGSYDGTMLLWEIH